HPGGHGLAAGSATPPRTRRDGEPRRGRGCSLPPMAGRARRLRSSLRQANGAVGPKDGPCHADLSVMLSAIVITRNEARNIAACLESLAFCDERIVVDCGSDDDTIKIAVAAGATVVSHAWAGFGAQKNFALSQARGDWVLSIDADERVPAPLAAEILSTMRAASACGYEIARLSTFLGRPMRHS